MKKRLLICLLVTVSLNTVSLADAQQPNVSRIGLLFAGDTSAVSARIEALRQGLCDLGYVEGKNIYIEYRYGEGKLDRISLLAAELVRRKFSICDFEIRN